MENAISILICYIVGRRIMYMNRLADSRLNWFDARFMLHTILRRSFSRFRMLDLKNIGSSFLIGYLKQYALLSRSMKPLFSIVLSIQLGWMLREVTRDPVIERPPTQGAFERKETYFSISKIIQQPGIVSCYGMYLNNLPLFK